jgi:hypothetical protein
MSTRHYSSEGEYPFVPGTSGEALKLSKGILDFYAVVQGDPTGALAPVPLPITYLQDASTSGAGVILTFRSVNVNGDYWEYTFTVPDITQEGSIDNVAAVGGDVTGMLVYNSKLLGLVTYSVTTNIEIEPARVQWHAEITKNLVFHNITRCNSVQDTDTLVEILDTASLVDDTLKFVDGYNTEVTAEDSVLTFEAAAGNGKGRMPNLGNTDTEVCPDVPLGEGSNGVLTINGLIPNNGDIPLRVSSALYIESSAGSIAIKKR